MTSARESEFVGPVGPSDKEVVALLQRLASARAHLLQAEQVAEDPKSGADTVAPRNDELEEAHTELLWAQAQFITASKEDRARKAVDVARTREKQVLRRGGFSTFHDYLASRSNAPTTNIQLEIARREFEAAQGEWDVVSRELAVAEKAIAPTEVLDLTGENPRRIA